MYETKWIFPLFSVLDLDSYSGDTEREVGYLHG